MNDNKHITRQKVIQGLEAAAEGHPGLYERKDGSKFGCVNTEVVGGKYVPSCIVGTFVVETLGIPAEKVPSGTYRVVVAWLQEEGWTFEPEAIATLGLAQNIQDTKKVSWETVVEIMYEFGDLLSRYRDDVRTEDAEYDVAING